MEHARAKPLIVTLCSEGASVTMVPRRGTMQGLLKSKILNALDCFPKGNHGNPKGYNHALRACMLVVVFTA